MISGTGSGRACLVDSKGKLIAEHSRKSSSTCSYPKWRLADDPEATKTHRSPTDHRIFEQSTSDIWQALATCCQTILRSSGVSPSQIKGVGYDATCSLAVTDRDGKPVSVSRTGTTEEDESDENLGKDGDWNVILWADHRAEEEAEVINGTGEGVLGFVGKTMSVRLFIRNKG